MRSKSWCTSSTRVRPVPSAAKRTSTSEANSARESGFHSALISQLTAKRAPGSQARTCPTTTSVPSSWCVYQRPPTNGSMIDFTIGVAPMLWVLGHQPSMPAVKTSKARCGLASTTTAFLTGAMLIVRFKVSSSLWGLRASRLRV